jgi:t-SNARE complex subunit (syntaxin)
MSGEEELRELLNISREIRKISEAVRNSARDSDAILTSIETNVRTVRNMAERSLVIDRTNDMRRRRVYMICLAVVAIVVLTTFDVV